MKRIVWLDPTTHIWHIDSLWETDVTPDAVNTNMGPYVRVKDTPRASFYAPAPATAEEVEAAL